MKKQKKALLLTCLMTSALVVTACGTSEESQKEIQKAEPASTVVENNTQEDNLSTPNDKDVSTQSNVKATESKLDTPVANSNTSSVTEDTKKAPSDVKEVKLSLFNVEEVKDFQAEFHSGWKKAPSSPQQATIDGRGEEALEEGQSVLVVKNTKTNISKVYTLKDGEQSQNTPKFVEWIDDNRVYVIIGFSYGTVSKGGNLYELNLSDNSVLPVIDNLKDNEEIVSIKQNTDGTFTYQKHIYDDENVSVGHFEEGTLPVSATK